MTSPSSPTPTQAKPGEALTVHVAFRAAGPMAADYTMFVHLLDSTGQLVAGNDSQFAKLCEVLGRPDLAKDARFATNSLRVANRDALNALLREATQQRSMREWTDALSLAGVPAGPINNVAQVFADPQVQARGMRIELEHPLAGTMPAIASPVRLSETPAQYRLAPPLLGEHTREVLRDLLGMNDAEIEALSRGRAI